MKRINLRKADVARSNTIRDINRQIILNFIREEGPISRADIAGVTELRRSIVSLTVRGDKNAVAALKETAHYIGIGISDLTRDFRPK